jgi:Flp pilus assembly protein TadD
MGFRFKIKDFHFSSININRSWWPYFTISLLVTLVYLPTFSGEFILDDNSLIKNNPYIKELHSVSSYLSQEDGIGDRGSLGSYHTGYYRPLVNLTYWIDYKLCGMSAPGFRTTNLVLHLLSSFLLFQLVILLVDDRQAAFWIALLFAFHPVNTESVSWISSRNNILVTLFALSAFYFYIRGWKNDSLKAMSISVFSFMLAILSKEFGLMVLPVLFLYQRFLSEERRNTLQELTGYLVFIVILVLYFILRKTATSALLTPSQMGNVWSRAYFFPYLIWENLRLILFPYGLHSFSIDYPKSVIGWQATAGFLSCILLGLFIWKRWKDKVLVFSVFSFLVSIVPILNLIPTSAVSLISMRWLYFPMPFILLGVARFIQKGIQLSRFVTLACVSVVTIYLGTYSYVLNKNLWHDESTFFDLEVLRFNNYLYAGGLAETLLEEKKYRDAERFFRIAINNYPQKPKNHINYSALLIDTGRPEEALLRLNRAKSLAMTYNQQGQWFNNMGMAYFNLGKEGEALRNFKKAIIFSPEEPQFWANLGGAYGSIGDYENSIFALKRGLDYAPESIQLRKNLAVTHLRMGEPGKAISVLEKMTPDKRIEQGVAELLNEASRALESNRQLE